MIVKASPKLLQRIEEVSGDTCHRRRTKQRWWQNCRETRVEETPTRDFLSCVYQSTKVVSCDWYDGTITLNNGGWVSNITVRRMNEVAHNYKFPFNVWKCDGYMYVTLLNEESYVVTSSLSTLKKNPAYNQGVKHFERTITIPINPETSYVFEGNYTGYDQKYVHSMRATFDVDDQGVLTITPSKTWNKKLRSYLKKFGETWEGEVKLTGEDAWQAKHGFLSNIQEGMLDRKKSSTVEIPVEPFLNKYVGFDSTLWLVKRND